MPAKFPLLQPPQLVSPGTFTVRARGARVKRDWDSLASRAPNDTQRGYVHLVTDPYRRVPGRVFPLRGKIYAGLWEFEINRSERLYYLPDAQKEPELANWSIQTATDQDEEKAPSLSGGLTHESGPSARQVERVCLVFACGGHISPPPR